VIEAILISLLCAVCIYIAKTLFLPSRRSHGNANAANANAASGNVTVSLSDISRIWVPQHSGGEGFSLAAAPRVNTPSPVKTPLLVKTPVSAQTGTPDRPVEKPTEAGKPAKAGGSAEAGVSAETEEPAEAEESANAGEPANAVGQTSAGEPANAGKKELMLFYQECVLPFSKTITEQNVRKTIEDLLGLLSEAGHVSSISTGDVNKAVDEEFLELEPLASDLAKTTLLRHTLTVTRILIDKVRETYAESDARMPMAVTVGLAHDIGKLGRGNHPQKSAEMLSEILPDDIPWAEHALQVIRSHHQKTSDQFTVLLKQADMQARSYELAAHMPGYNVAPFSRWFDAERFLKDYIGPEINIAQQTGWQAFSLNGCVYVKPKLLYSAANAMCRDMNVIDVRFFCGSEYDNTLREILQNMKKAGYLHDMARSQKSGGTAKSGGAAKSGGTANPVMNFELVTRMPGPRKISAMLVPVRGELFDLQELEKRKTDFLAEIRDLK